MTYTGERMIPWNPATGAWVMHHHVARYAWALPFVYGQTVADLGCGTGYGSFMLSWAAKSVVGIDIDRETIDFAKERFQYPNLHFEVGDITQYLPGADAYVAFEVIEHLEKPQEMIDKLKGTLLWSVPVEEASRFHVRAYRTHEIDAMMGGGGWVQSETGEIARRDQAQFRPKYLLGVRVV